jgi:hypothetical protein
VVYSKFIPYIVQERCRKKTRKNDYRLSLAVRLLLSRMKFDRVTIAIICLVCRCIYTAVTRVVAIPYLRLFRSVRMKF